MIESRECAKKKLRLPLEISRQPLQQMPSRYTILDSSWTAMIIRHSEPAAAKQNLPYAGIIQWVTHAPKDTTISSHLPHAHVHVTETGSATSIILPPPTIEKQDFLYRPDDLNAPQTKDADAFSIH